MRRLRPQEKKRVGAFRWIRGLDEALNFGRFMRHVARLKRKVYADPSFMGKYRLRNRRSRQIARLAKARLLGVEQLLNRRALAADAGVDEPACNIAAPGDEIPSLLPACLAAANDE